MRDGVDQFSVKGLIAKKRTARKKAATKCAPAKAKPRKKKAKGSSLDVQIARKKTRAKRKSSAKCAPAKKKRPVAKKPVKPKVRVPAAPAVPVVFPPAPPPTAETPATQPPPVDAPVVPPGQPTPEVPPPPPPPPDSRPTSPIAMYTGPFGHAQATRLLYRAAFGPRPGEADELASMGLRDAVATLTRPKGDAVLEGPAPLDKQGNPWQIDPVNVYEMDALYWFDRMMRSSHQLVERMALVLHDWFATNENGIPQLFMLNQTNLFRKHCFGSFKNLVHDITADPAMILWLNLNKSVVNVPNENYARELMELFTLGAGNGYTEHDIREASRALTGWTSQGDQEAGTLTHFELIASKHDYGQKTIFGQTGNFDWKDVARLVIEHPSHPVFFVKKLWSYFIPSSPTSSEVSALADLYKSSGYQIRPVLEAILLHPALYEGAPMVKPPVVYIAGLLRAKDKYLRGELWTANARLAGQRLYQPPDVGGWDDSRWLDSNTFVARWQTVYQIMVSYVIKATDPYPAAETADEALESALAFWDHPVLRPETREVLLEFARGSVPGTPSSGPRAHRQNALRHLIAVSPDFQAC